MPENPLAAMMKLDPAFIDHMKQADGFIFGEGALPKKMKYLIAMAFDAASSRSFRSSDAAMPANMVAQMIGLISDRSVIVAWM